MSTPLKEQTIRGIGWTATARVLRQAVQLVLLGVLARLLDEDDFGLVGMAVVFTGFVQLFSEAGFGAALVQRRELDEEHLHSVFWLTVAIGLALGGLVYLGAPVLATFFEEPALLELTRLAAAGFVLGSFGVVPAARLKRRMDFRTQTLIELGALLVGGVTAVVLALRGAGPFSLIGQTLAAQASASLGLLTLGGWRPRPIFRLQAVRELARFSGNLLGFQVFNYWVRNADNLIVGKLVGRAALGIYSRAYGIMLQPVAQVSAVLGQVMIPALARIQGDAARVRRAFLQANRLVALGTFPVLLGLWAVAGPFIDTLLGPGWEGVVPVLEVLCWVGLIQPVRSTGGWLFISQGRTDVQFRWGLFSGVVTVAAFLFGVRWGIEGVAWAYLIRSYLLFYPGMALATGLVQLPLRSYLRELLPPLLAALAMAALVRLVASWVPGSWPAAARLGVLVPAGAVVYLALLHFARLRAYTEAVDLLRERRAGRGPEQPT